MKNLLFISALAALLAVASHAQTPAGLELELHSADATQVTIKPKMTILTTTMQVEAVSVAVAYNPAHFNINATTTISNLFFDQYNWDDASMANWDADGINPDVAVYGEYHPNFGTQTIFRGAPPTLCHFNFYPKSGSPFITSFVVYANNPTAALTYYFENNTQKNFDPVVNLIDITVPVELALFTAAQQGAAITLRWVTATETNNFGFHVERRAEGSGVADTWETLGFVQGAGDTRSESQYLFVDQSMPGDGLYLYRLRQQDYDGSVTYSPEARVDYRLQPAALALEQNYPNPVSLSAGSGTTFTYDLPEAATVRLTISDMLGRSIGQLFEEQRPAGRYSARWNPAGLPAGTYIATLAVESATTGGAEFRHLRVNVIR